ncbi:hypothetical protein DFH94DRAFT_695387 [Russula ochroleuca]|uniref:Uncharacterized protein n=1 Tax=Russula ochroleuca TaxID=152965 RepID=A0A9P5T4Z7_9AGAM|nr:hypothetical protein DFH94DRAFT_695387 [Russula ochroleuca]
MPWNHNQLSNSSRFSPIQSLPAYYTNTNLSIIMLPFPSTYTENFTNLASNDTNDVMSIDSDSDDDAMSVDNDNNVMCVDNDDNAMNVDNDDNTMNIDNSEAITF